jgi:D-sedoheptulose 7-phosphate isomerase
VVKDLTPEIDSYFTLVSQVLANLDRRGIHDLVDELLAVRERNGCIYVFGNGGSAATAVHFYSDLMKGVSYGLKKRFRVLCFNDNVSAITCVANDLSYEDIFLEQLKNFIQSVDLVFGISCSGNSPNVVKAMEYARSCGVRTAGLGAFTGGQLLKLSDIFVLAPIDSFEVSEDVHLIVVHLLKTLLMKSLRHEYR